MQPFPGRCRNDDKNETQIITVGLVKTVILKRSFSIFIGKMYICHGENWTFTWIGYRISCYVAEIKYYIVLSLNGLL